MRPNPASEYIAIDHPEGVSRIQLVDVFGSSVVYDANNEGGQSTIISTAHLAPGAYRCVITSATRSIVTLPFVVVR